MLPPDVNVTADLGMLLKGFLSKRYLELIILIFILEAYKVDYAVYEPRWSNMNGKDVIYDLVKIQ